MVQHSGTHSLPPGQQATASESPPLSPLVSWSAAPFVHPARISPLPLSWPHTSLTVFSGTHSGSEHLTSSPSLLLSHTALSHSLIKVNTGSAGRGISLPLSPLVSWSAAPLLPPRSEHLVSTSLLAIHTLSHSLSGRSASISLPLSSPQDSSWSASEKPTVLLMRPGIGRNLVAILVQHIGQGQMS